MWVNGGAGDHHGVRFNRESFEHLELVTPAETSAISPEAVQLETSVLGTPTSCPIVLGPASGQGNVHADGALAVFRAAAEANVIMMLSIFNPPYDQVVSAAKGTLWLQVFPEHLENGLELAEAAIAAGSPGLMVTVDSSFAPRDDVAKRATPLPKPDLKQSLRAPLRDFRDWLLDLEPDEGDRNNPHGLPYRAAWPTWTWVAELREKLGVPIVVKGVLAAEDALLAKQAGAAAVVVSSHGGRVLDYAVPALEVVAEVVDAVGPDFPVLLDSGIRSGADVFRALALGAHAVLLGRPVFWGLRVGGDAGVVRVIQILREELRAAMVQAGCATLADINRGHVRWIP
jgi:4-hydroxymandelate oxidase